MKKSLWIIITAVITLLIGGISGYNIDHNNKEKIEISTTKPISTDLNGGVYTVGKDESLKAGT